MHEIGTQQVTIVKSTGEREPFEPEKLLESLIRAGVSEKTRNDIVTHVMAELKDGMSTSQIYKHAFFLLKKRERPAATKYALRRAVMDLGPSGFPFEKFIAEIYREMGYEVLTGQTVYGTCVPHEIDVIAWNENKLTFVEAKFHNAHGLKSDMKVVLYVKAREDDLREATYNYGRPRKLDEFILMTNTKFSKTALMYAECKGMKLIGWNYPAKGNLQDMIEDTGLHPLTSLTMLTNKEKALLLQQGIVLAKTLAADPAYLHSIGLSDEKTRRVLSEVKTLLAN